MSELKYRIICIRHNPEYAQQAVDWFSSKWNIDHKEYERSMDDCIHNNNRLPQWYLALDEKDEIIGGCGLIDNDFVDRTDLWPYLCALYVEKRARGHALGGSFWRARGLTAAGSDSRSCIFVRTIHRTMRSTVGGTSAPAAIPGVRHRGYTKRTRSSRLCLVLFKAHLIDAGLGSAEFSGFACERFKSGIHRQ